MKLLNVATRKSMEVPDSFALRLIEQGRAVLAPEDEKPAAKLEKGKKPEKKEE